MVRPVKKSAVPLSKWLEDNLRLPAEIASRLAEEIMSDTPLNREEFLAVLARLAGHLDKFKHNTRQTVREDHPRDAPTFIPLKQAAGRTGFSVETVRQWVVRGFVIGKRVGGRRFVDQRSLDEQVRQRSSTAA